MFRRATRKILPVTSDNTVLVDSPKIIGSGTQCRSLLHRPCTTIDSSATAHAIQQGRPIDKGGALPKCLRRNDEASDESRMRRRGKGRAEDISGVVRRHAPIIVFHGQQWIQAFTDKDAIAAALLYSSWLVFGEREATNEINVGISGSYRFVQIGDEMRQPAELPEGVAARFFISRPAGH